MGEWRRRFRHPPPEERDPPLIGVFPSAGGQLTISLEYQINQPTNPSDTLVTGMSVHMIVERSHSTQFRQFRVQLTDHREESIAEYSTMYMYVYG